MIFVKITKVVLKILNIKDPFNLGYCKALVKSFFTKYIGYFFILSDYKII